MIEKGYKSKDKYWGEYRVKDVVKLKNKVECYSHEKGRVLFNPTIVKLEWENPPSEDKHDLWFPYWGTIGSKEKYGQFAPMIGERALLELLENAIDHDFFGVDFLKQLNNAVTKKLTP